MCAQCGRQRPRCANCSEAASECLERRMGITLDPADKEGHASVEALEQRVEHLRRLTGQTSATAVSPDDARISATASQSRLQDDQTPRSQGSILGEPSDGIRFLPLSAMTEIEDRGSSENKVGFSTLLGAALTVSDATGSGDDESTADDLSAEAQLQPPRLSHTFTISAVRQYLSLCEAYCPFVNGEWLLQNANVQGSTGTPRPSSRDGPECAILCDLAVATGIFLRKGHRSRGGWVSTLLEQSKKRLQQSLSEMDGTAEVQCILALALLANFSPTVGSMWHLTGQVVPSTRILHSHLTAVDVVAPTFFGRGQVAIPIDAMRQTLSLCASSRCSC